MGESGLFIGVLEGISVSEVFLELQGRERKREGGGGEITMMEKKGETEGEGDTCSGNSKMEGMGRERGREKSGKV